MRKTTGKVLAVMLAFAMALGIFAGTGLPVRAEGNTYNLTHGGNNGEEIYGIAVGEILPGGSTISATDGYLIIYDSNGIFMTPFPNPMSWTLPTGKNYKVFDSYFNVGGSNYVFYMEIITPAPSDDPAASGTKPHEHYYTWETVQEPSKEQDGLEEYRCSCGDVKERNVIPAGQAFVSGLYSTVKDALPNGTVKFDSGSWTTLSDYIIRKLAERSDVTTVITFEYGRKSYKMTIPTGVDYSSILADDDSFYGYFCFAGMTGSTIEETVK